MKIIQKILGINKLLEESKHQTEILKKIHQECTRNSDLVETYNKAYHIK